MYMHAYIVVNYCNKEHQWPLSRDLFVSIYSLERVLKKQPYQDRLSGHTEVSDGGSLKI